VSGENICWPRLGIDEISFLHIIKSNRILIEFSGQKGDLSLLSPLVRKMQYLIKYSQANSEIFPSRESFVGGGIGE